jgi:hypothetical protein
LEENNTFQAEHDELTQYWDEVGTFWVNKLSSRARKSILDAKTNIEFVCKPFEELRAHNVALVLPVGVEGDFDINTYKTSMESTIIVTEAGDTENTEPQTWIREHEDKLVEVAHDFDYALMHKKRKAVELQAQESFSDSEEGIEELRRFQKADGSHIHKADMMYLAAKRRQDEFQYTGPALLTEQDILEDEETDMDDTDEEMDDNEDTDMEDEEEESGHGSVEQVQNSGIKEDIHNTIMGNAVKDESSEKESTVLEYEPSEFDGLLAQGL